MSEEQSRPGAPRGRSHRGGRGGYKGGRGASKNTKSDTENVVASPDERGEISETKDQHGSNVSTLRELFPDWTSEDVEFALEETGWKLDNTIEKITNGSISQWSKVAKKSRNPREAPGVSIETTGTRGTRGRGGSEGRTRGRGTDRVRGARGGRGNSHTNGTRSSEKAAKPVQDGLGDIAAAGATTQATGSWVDASVDGDPAATDQPLGIDASKGLSAKSEEMKRNAIPTGKVSGWAGLFAKPVPEPAPKKIPVGPTPPPPSAAEESAAQPEERVPEESPEQPLSEPSIDGSSNHVVEAAISDSAVTLTPSQDELTHDNLEQIPDESQPITTATAASTIATTQDPHSNLNSTQPSFRPSMSGYVTSALKATSGAGRSLSFQRRVLEQQEAVVMPENHAISRAAMQFGSMNVNGSPDGLGLDEDREEPETRTQLLDDSPIAPKASLPPPPVSQPQSAAEPAIAARPAPGLPPAPQQQPTSPPQTTAYADQFARYGQPGQKAFDTFGQPSVQQQQSQALDAFASQPSTQPPQPPQPSTSAPNDYSAFYNPEAQRNLSYQSYYGYGQNQEVQPRSGSAFGTTGTESQSQVATSRPLVGSGQQDAPHSGNITPNSAVPSQHHQQQSQQMHQAQGSHGGYPFGYANAGYNQPFPQYASYMSQLSQHQYGQNRPMFDDARRYDDSYMSHGNQYSGYGRQYGGHYTNKSGMYNQPPHQYSYEQSTSPANAGSFNQSSMGREAVYGRTGSVQPSEPHQVAGSTFGGMNDPFSREQSGFGGHTPMSQQHPGQIGLDDSAKGYDPTKTGGPSPSMKHVQRPGSAANNMQSQQGGQSGVFPPPQSQQANHQAFAGYPQYGVFGGNVGAHQQGQSNHPPSTQQYGGYGGSAAFGNYGGGYGSGRGWNGSYGGGH